MTMPSSLPRLVVYLDPPELKEKLEALAKKQRRTMSALLCMLIEQEIERDKNEK